MLSRFHLIPERHGRTGRQTDRRTDVQIGFAISVCWRAIKMSSNFGYMGRSNPLCDLDQCGMWADIVDVITCPYLVTVGGCEFGERSNFALSHWLEVSPYNNAHTDMWPCDIAPVSVWFCWDLVVLLRNVSLICSYAYSVVQLWFCE